ncbi:hypothetical protein WJX72_002016 [[Myrmecia] bisecta]|uniref:Mitochondrial-processing peptidase subunit alpha n=1 Tax=[Myrmecia] bisecta TaxID=41462 RepID=A0AAW1PD40_9CHLO
MLATGIRRGLPQAVSDARLFSSSSATSAALPALADTATKSGGGFLSKIFGGSSARISVPLTDPLPGVDQPAAFSPPAKRPETETTTLSNGLKISSEATLGPTSTLGLYVDAGSVYETPEQSGVSHLLEYMAFKSTLHRTHFRLVREVEGMGGNVMASASREQMAYNIDCVKTNVPEALEVLADAVLNPKFDSWVVAEQLKKLEKDIKNIKENPQMALLEGIHNVAYQGGLGRPLVCPEGAVRTLSADTLHEFVATHYTAPRIVLAAAGVEHQALVSLAKPLLEGVNAGPGKQPKVESKYLGGDYRQFAAGPETHAVLAFEFEGGWRDLTGAIAVTVLQFLLGGGGSFSAGGPGKGMHSRLYTRVLNQHGWMHNCTAFNSLYNDTGIVGIFATAQSSHADEMVGVITKELQAITKAVPEEELTRAKNAAVASVLYNLESRAVVAEDIGRQILTYGHRKPVAEFITALESVTAADLAKLCTKMLKSKLTMACLGDVANVPRYDAVAKRFA